MSTRFSGKRARVLIVDPVHASLIAAMTESYDVVERLGLDQESLRKLLPDMDAIVLRSGVKLGAQEFDVASNLRFVARAGVGVDNVDLASASARGVAVFNAPDLGAASVAEFTFAMILAIARKVPLADRQLRAGQWRKHELAGAELSGKIIGVLGYGSIGRRVAEIAKGFGMRVIASVATPTPERAVALQVDGVELTSTQRLLETADVISLHCPLTAATHKLVDARSLSLVKRGAFLVNMARGGVIDEDALHHALSSGRLAGAAADVLLHEKAASALISLDNFIATPHIGAMTDEAQKRIAAFVLGNLQRGFNGQPMENRLV